MSGWIVRQEWHQFGGDGIYSWSLWDEDALMYEGRPLARIAEGYAFTRFGVRWQVFRVLQKNGYERSWRAFLKRSFA